MREKTFIKEKSARYGVDAGKTPNGPQESSVSATLELHFHRKRLRLIDITFFF